MLYKILLVLNYLLNASTCPDDEYRQVSNKRRTVAGNTFVDHADAVGTSPVSAAPTKSSFSA